MILSEYEAKRHELEEEMQKLNGMESEKKMELSIKYQSECKRINSQIGQLKHKQKELLSEYKKDKVWWHQRFKGEKQMVSEKMHLLRMEYLTANNVDFKEVNNESRNKPENG